MRKTWAVDLLLYFTGVNDSRSRII
jgi:hypothetical protein